MKAIRISRTGGPEVLEYLDIDLPPPRPGEARVKHTAIGVNFIDTYHRSGLYKLPLPTGLGSEAAGVVEAVGEGVKASKPGQRVYTAGAVTGTYAELALCSEPQVHLLPDKISFEQGAALGVPYATAYYGMFLRGKAMAGETVLVHGASGGVGIAAVQFAHAIGLTIIGTAGTENGKKLVAEQGAQHVLDHHEPDYLKQVMTLTGDRGVELVLEMVAHQNLGKVLGVLAKFGRVVVVGSRGPVEINPRDTMSRDADIRGMSVMNATPKDLHGIHSAIFAGLENGTLRPIVGRKFPLADAAKAHEAIMEPGSYGKIVLVP
jgi:NADPH2:quinone reductase